MRIILKFSEKYKCLGVAFYLQSSRYVSNGKSCFKTTGLFETPICWPPDAKN